MKLNELTITTRLVIGLVIIVLLILASGVISILSSNRLADISDQMYRHPLMVSNALRDIQVNHVILHHSLNDLVASENKEQMESAWRKVKNAEKKVLDNLKVVSERFLGNMTEVQKVQRLFIDSKLSREKTIQLMRQGERSKAVELIHKYETEYSDIFFDEIQKMIEFANNKAITFNNEAKSIRQSITKHLFLFNIFIFLFGLFIVIVIIRNIIVPVRQIINEIKKISENHFTHNLKIRSKNEIKILNSLAEELDNLDKHLCEKEKEFDLARKKSIKNQENLEEIVEERTYELKDTKQLLSKAIDDASIGIIMVKPDGSYSRVNKAFCEMLGYTEEELLSMTYKEVIHPDDVEISSGFIRKLRNENMLKASFENRYIHKNGTIVHGQLTLTLIRDNDKEPQFYFVQVQDVNQRKKAEIQLYESEQKFRSISAATHDAIIMINGDGNIIYLNKSAEDMFGYAYKEVIGKNPHDLLVPKGYYKKARAGFAAFKKNGNGPLIGNSIELTALHHDGHEFQIEILVSSLKMNNSWHAVALIRDISDRKQIEHKLKDNQEHLEKIIKKRTLEIEKTAKEMENSQQALAYLVEDVNESRVELEESNRQLAYVNKELESFSYSVSHDLRAPLRAIDGFTRILMTDYVARLDDEGKRLGSVIQQSAQKMGQLIDDLLSFSRIGREAMHFSNIDMGKMANTIYREVVDAEERKRVVFNVSDLPNAKGDSNMIRQVWVNLISNAHKYTTRRKQAFISITSQEEEDNFIYCVKDNGAGFDMRYKDKLFGVFQRLHSEKEFKGTGVGLALVQRIIHRHGGRVWAESKVNKGAAFYFTLLKKTGELKSEKSGI